MGCRGVSREQLVIDVQAVLIDARRLAGRQVAPVIPIGFPARYDRPALTCIYGSEVGSMREEIWVASPEPATGVFTTAGTCQGRLWRHCVIGYAAP